MVLSSLLLLLLLLLLLSRGLRMRSRCAEASAAALEAQLRSGEEGLGSALGEVGFAIFGSPKAGSPADDQQA
jgi:hypothetical protein